MPVVKLRLEGGNRQKTRRRCSPLRQRHTDRIQLDRPWRVLRRNSGRGKSRLSDRDVHDLSRRPRQTLGSTHAIDGGDLSVSMARQLPSWGLETWIQYAPCRLVLRERTERDIDKPGQTGLRTHPVAHSADIPKRCGGQLPMITHGCESQNWQAQSRAGSVGTGLAVSTVSGRRKASQGSTAGRALLKTASAASGCTTKG